MASSDFVVKPTIIRMKRYLGADSSETVVVSSKRKRLCGVENDESPSEIYATIFKKFITLQSSDSLEDETKKAVEKEIKHSSKLRENYKKLKNHSSVTNLMRERVKSDIAAIKFKLFCSRRDIDSSETDKGADFHLLDALKAEEETPMSLTSCSQITQRITCNDVPLDSEKVDYVYDLYYASLPLEISLWMNNICDIQKFKALDFTYEDESQSEKGDDDEDDDENEESNWRNDYPEEENDDNFSNEDDFICKKLMNTQLNDSDESFDVQDYDENDDFDEDGNLILYNQSSN